jgi:hypothetical protein
MENAVRNMWGYQYFFSSFSTNSRGTAMLINNLDFKPLAKKGDPDGNYFILNDGGPNSFAHRVAHPP